MSRSENATHVCVWARDCVSNKAGRRGEFHFFEGLRPCRVKLLIKIQRLRPSNRWKINEQLKYIPLCESFWKFLRNFFQKVS